MGMDSISYVMKKVDDENMKENLSTQFSEYGKIVDKVNTQFEHYGEVPDETPITDKMMGWTGIQLNTITDKTLLQEWLNKDPRAGYLIYKIDINKLLQYNLLIPNSILNDDNFPCYLIKSVINNTEFYEKLLLEYKKYINAILNSYDYNTQIFNFYFNSSSDNYLLPKYLQEKLKNSDEKQKITILKEETSFKLSEIIVDSIFEDNIYNVKLNLNEIIRYTSDINVNLISPEHLNFYKIILNIDSLSNEEKINLYNNSN